MSARLPLHAPARHPRRSEATEERVDLTLPVPVVMTLGISALWMLLAIGLQQLAVGVFGMTGADGWAFAIGIVSYVYLVAGFMVGVIALVRSEG